jgi:hypothetical protein
MFTTCKLRKRARTNGCAGNKVVLSTPAVIDASGLVNGNGSTLHSRLDVRSRATESMRGRGKKGWKATRVWWTIASRAAATSTHGKSNPNTKKTNTTRKQHGHGCELEISCRPVCGDRSMCMREQRRRAAYWYPRSFMPKFTTASAICRISTSLTQLSIACTCEHAAHPPAFSATEPCVGTIKWGWMAVQQSKARGETRPSIRSHAIRAVRAWVEQVATDTTCMHVGQRVSRQQ